MNSGKKVIKGDAKPAKKKVEAVALQEDGRAKIFIGVAVALALLMVVYIVWENHHPRYLVSIDGEKSKIEDMMYDVYETEEAYAYMESFYAQLGYNDYWNTPITEDGQTARDMAREECMTSFIQGTVLYKEALENGYEVTEEDRKQAEDIMASMQGEGEESPADRLGFTAEELTGLLEQRAVATRYREDLMEGYGVTEAEVTGQVDKAQYRQYDIEYFSISVETTDENGARIPVTDAEKAERRKKLEDVLAQAGSKEWSTVISNEEAEEGSQEEGEAEAKAEGMPEYDTDGFIESESSFDEATTAMLMAMENGAVSDIIESDGSYYVIKMVNNNSTERYEKELEDAVDEEKRARFQEDYNAMEAKHSIEIYEKDWNRVEFGNITL